MQHSDLLEAAREYTNTGEDACLASTLKELDKLPPHIYQAILTDLVVSPHSARWSDYLHLVHRLSGRISPSSYQTLVHSVIAFAKVEPCPINLHQTHILCALAPNSAALRSLFSQSAQEKSSFDKYLTILPPRRTTLADLRYFRIYFTKRSASINSNVWTHLGFMALGLRRTLPADQFLTALAAEHPIESTIALGTPGYYCPPTLLLLLLDTILAAGELTPFWDYLEDRLEGIPRTRLQTDPHNVLPSILVSPATVWAKLLANAPTKTRALLMSYINYVGTPPGLPYADPAHQLL